ncbi:MAG: D-glycero-beta-D-manno-heptose 1-phosphate adenylyltransferase [Caulobacterales bacterium 32-69-10]|nr:MAG: D-glycero-beta-D-manno-heptose 1-phosphate adenylyltransferase [Caulobacterales bacterium 32-69-10]
MDLATLQQRLARAAQAKVACVGDLMLDRYVYGDVARISPEAPIPVLVKEGEATMLGAAGNVARNAAALGAQVELAGVVGDDAPGHETARLIETEPRLEGHLVPETGRCTTVKTRFVASGQQLLRLDAEDDRPISAMAEAKLIQAIGDAVDGAGALLFSDYAKGAATPKVIAAAREAARQAGAPMIVDPKGRSFAKYGPVDLVKPNARELSLTVDRPVRTDAEVESALAEALASCEARAILVTRAAQGMSLAVRGQPVRHFRSAPRTVFDVTGAGDTTLAALGVALAGGATLEEAVELALLAAGVVVGKVGTAVASPAELIEAEIAAHQAPAEARVATLARAVDEAARWRRAGLKVGFTNGCFDILHKGHVAYLAQARGWCDRLVVAVNSDASVRALKGEGRPVNDLESRALVLAGLEGVDLVTPFDEATPLALIEALRPDVLIKGADYSVETVVGADLVLSYGGEVKLAALVDGYSTTAAIARMGKTA